MDNDWFMFSFKVVRCPRRHVHDWSRCPYAHKSEVAARRDPRQFLYWPEPCPDSSKDPAKCPRGKACPYSHSIFEYWLHPARYKTQMCQIGDTCRRTVCFFAHRPHELRTPDFPVMPPHATAIDAAATVLAVGQPAAEGTAAPDRELQQSPVIMQYAAWQQAQLQQQQQQQPPDAVYGAMNGTMGLLPQQQGDMAAGATGWRQPSVPGVAVPAPYGMQAGPLPAGVGGTSLHPGYPAGSAGSSLGRDQQLLTAVSAAGGRGAQVFMPWDQPAAGASASSRELAMAAGLMPPGAVLVTSAPGAPGGLVPVAPASSGTPSGAFLQPGAAAGFSRESVGVHQQQQQQPQHQQLMTFQQQHAGNQQQHAGNQQRALPHQQLPQLLYSAPQQQLAGMPIVVGGTLQQQGQQQNQHAMPFLQQPANLVYSSSSMLQQAAVVGGAVVGASPMAVGMLHTPLQADQALLSLQLSHLGLQASSLGGQ